ncbi:MAG: T9SS type B sorting domain-containing protein [Bacteroidales bacterium]|nr:T9SS type B sorting domain-containing protein [Bacteroidales bacterium]
MKHRKKSNFRSFIEQTICFVLLTLILFSPRQIHSQSNALVINGANIIMDGGTSAEPIYLIVNQNSSDGIVRHSGHIHSENQYNYVKWISGSQTGNYVIPFGIGGNQANYIPFTFDKVSTNSAHIQMSTWHTDIPNYPRPQATNVNAVTNMLFHADSVDYAIDRFWDIRASNTTANLTFSYLGIENTTINPTGNVRAQHWNGNSWDEPVLPGTPGVTSGVGTAGVFQNQNTFSPWVLSIAPFCIEDTISYPQTAYCNDDSNSCNIVHTEDGTTGTYSAVPAGLHIDVNTGAITPSLSEPGTYTVTLTVAATPICPEYETSTTVTILPTPEVEVLIPTVCYATNATITAQVSPNGSYSYAWTTPASVPNPGNVNSFTSNVEGNYSVTVTSINGCTSSATANFAYPELLDAYFTKEDVSCNGGSDGSIDITVEGGTPNYSFQWSDGATTEDRQGLTNGNYSLTVTDAIGCTVSLIVPITQAPAISISGNINNVSCFGGGNGSISATVSGGNSGGYNYSWNNGQTTAIISNLEQGTYILTVTDTKACTQTASYTVTQPNQIQISGTTNSPNCFEGNDGSVNITVNGGTPEYSYSWSNSATSQNLNNVQAGVYTITVSDANSCTKTASFEINNPDQMLINSTVIPETCDNDNGAISIVVNGGTPDYTYAWSSNTNNATVPNISNLNNDTYSVTVSDANGCVKDTTFHVERITPPEIVITDVVNETCSDANASITVEVINGRPDYNYLWSSNAGNNSPNLSNISEGAHYLTITDADGCLADTIIYISNHQAPQPFITGISPAHCGQSDGGASFAVSGQSDSYTYEWNTSPARFGNSENDLAGGTYIISVSDGICDVEYEITIPDLPGPTAHGAAHPSVAYEDNANIRFVDLSEGDIESWYWDFDNGFATSEKEPRYEYNMAGEYDVVLYVVDKFGCTDVDTVKVLILPGMEVWIPDAFSPNGDGLNESFGPVLGGVSEKGYEFVIYDRWGKKAFYTNDINKRWDGTINGVKVELNSVFVYKLRVENLLGKEFYYTGRVTLVYGLE